MTIHPIVVVYSFLPIFFLDFSEFIESRLLIMYFGSLS